MGILPIRATRALFLLGAAFFTLGGRAATLEWAPSIEAVFPNKIVGYKLYYAAEDFTGLPTNGFPPVVPFVLSVGLQTNAVVTNLVAGLTYYFAAVAVDNRGVESPYSNLATFTAPPEGFPPPPPPGDTNSDGSTGGGSGSGSGTNSIPTAVSLIGMLPRLWIYSTNGQAFIAVSGTVGATFAIQSSANPGDVDSWVTITNLTLTVAAPNANTNPVTTLERAFIPALESIEDPNPIDGTLRYYRIYMPLGYAILANQVLAHQEIQSRLVAVRLPGINAYIVCYVTTEAAYLDYNDKTYVVRLEASGPTIREVATKVAATLNQNWTSASEFTVTEDGAKLLFATVVQTDDPSTDPPLGVPRATSSDISIDF